MSVTIAKDYDNYYRPESIDWMQANVGEWQTVKVVVAYAVVFQGDITNTLSVITSSQIKNNQGISWNHLGFEVGDMINFIYTSDVGGVLATQVINEIISAIDNDFLSFASPVLTGLPTTPVMPGMGSDTTGTLIETTNIQISINKVPQSLDLKLGHVENADAGGGNTSSVIDGSNVVRRAVNLDLLPFLGNTAMTSIGIQSGMAIRTGNLQYITNIFFFHLYEMTIQFMYHGVFDDTSDYSNLNDLILPDYFKGINCLTDVYRFKFFPVTGNPNVFVENKIDNNPQQGNTGGWGESYNQGDITMAVESIVYKNIGGDVISTLDYKNDTDVEFLISGVPNLATLLTKCTFGFMYLPQDEDDYFNNNVPFHHNIFANTGGLDPSDVWTVDTAIPVSLAGWGLDNKNMNFTNPTLTIDGLNVKVTFRVEPTTPMGDFFESKDVGNRNFLIYFNSGDHAKVTNLSDRSSIIVDFGNMQNFPTPLGSFGTVRFFPHDKDVLVPAEGLASYDSFVEDDLVVRTAFFRDSSATDVYKSISFGVQVRNTTTGEVNILEKRVVDLTIGVYELDGTFYIDYDSTRNFKYISGSQKNWVKVNRLPFGDIFTLRFYEAIYALKIRWEDWISRSDISDDFIDVTLLNNGKNNDWYHYFITLGWAFESFTELVFEDENGALFSQKNEEQMFANDYDLNLTLTKTHNYYRDSDNTLINVGIDPDTGKPLGTILVGELTRYEVLFTITDADTWDPAFTDYWGTINLEIFRGSGEIEHRQISTLLASEADCPLIPVAGEVLCKMDLINPSVLRLSCRIEPSFLLNAPKYHLSARIEGFPGIDGKIMEDGTGKIMEDGTVKILE